MKNSYANSFKENLARQILDKDSITNQAVQAVMDTSGIARPVRVRIVDIQKLEVIIEAAWDSGQRKLYRVRISEVKLS